MLEENEIKIIAMSNEPRYETGQDVAGVSLTASDDVPPAASAVHGAREQGSTVRRHGRGWTRMLVTAGAVAAVGVTAALLAGSVSHPPSALAATTSALAKTSADSYTFSLDSTVMFAGREVRSDVITGAFDTGHELGTELLTTHSAKAQIRFVGKYVYISVSPSSGLGTMGKPWSGARIPPPGTDVLPEADPYGFSTEQPVSPAELLGVLRSAATVRDSGPASGPGWTSTRYTFTARLSPREFLSGTIYVDQQGRVRRLVTITTEKKVTQDRDLTFGNFGAPVQAAAPPASQVRYTSRTYWGFYF